MSMGCLRRIWGVGSWASYKLHRGRLKVFRVVRVPSVVSCLLEQVATWFKEKTLRTERTLFFAGAGLQPAP